MYTGRFDTSACATSDVYAGRLTIGSVLLVVLELGGGLVTVTGGDAVRLRSFGPPPPHAASPMTSTEETSIESGRIEVTVGCRIDRPAWHIECTGSVQERKDV